MVSGRKFPTHLDAKYTFDRMAMDYQHQKLMNAQAALENELQQNETARDDCHLGHQCTVYVPKDKISSQKLFKDLVCDFMRRPKHNEVLRTKIAKIMSRDREAIIFVDLNAEEDVAFGLTKTGEYLMLNFGHVDDHQSASEALVPAAIEKRFHELMKSQY